jgi:ATP-binding cassette subfamily B protein
MNAPHEEEIRHKPYDPRLMRRLLIYLRPYRGRVALLVGATLVLAASHLFIPHVLQGAIDGPMARGEPQALWPYAAAYVGTLAVVGLLHIWQGYVMIGLGLRVTRDLRLRVYSHLQKMSLSYYDRHPVGRLMTRVMGDVDALNELLSAGIVTAASDLFLLIGVVAVMVAKHPPLAACTLSVLVLLVPMSEWFRRAARRLYREIRLRVSQLNIFTQENITGMRVVQAFDRQRRNFELFRSINEEHSAWWKRAVVRHSLFSSSVQFLQMSAVAVVVGYGGTRILQGDPAVTIGLLVAFIRYSHLFFRPVGDLTEKYNILLAAMASSERIFELLDTDERIRQPAAPKRLGAVRGEVVFDGVWMSYGRGDVLRGVSFRIAPGERVALVGHTGAGKTSVISALYRFYEIARGRISLDGIPIDEAELSDLRRRMTLVLQEPFLFSGTILENLRMGRDDLSAEKVEQACRAVQIHEFIMSRGGYQGEVQERGASFSEGDRQLLSFARALVFDPAVLLLDEATAHVDTRTEHLLQEGLRALVRGRTSLVIAHRLSTIREADRILVFDRGELREEGNHETLMRQGGVYAHLYGLQETA